MLSEQLIFLLVVAGAVVVIALFVRLKRGDLEKSSKSTTPKPGSVVTHKARISAKSSSQSKYTRPGKQSKGKRIVFGGVELKRLSKVLAADLEGTDPELKLVVEPESHKYAGAMAVWAGDFLGYLPKEVAQAIREAGILSDLNVRLEHLWMGDRGGAVVRVNLDGTKETFMRVLKYRIEQRQPKKTSTPGEYQGYPTFSYQDDIQLAKLAGNWSGLETLLLNLTKAESKNPLGPAPYTFMELAKLYRKQKRYAEEISLLEDYLSKSGSVHGAKVDEMPKRIQRAKELLENSNKKKQSTF